MLKAQQQNKGFSVSFQVNHPDIKFGRELGKGGFGVVYQGTWRHNDVAIKQLLIKNLSDESKQEFETESQIMASLRSPNIVQFYGYCVSPEYCIVMEYMPKGSLFNVLHSKEPLSWEIRGRIATDMALGVSFLHSEHIIHRDIKSLNVLLGDNFKAKLTDFGLSKVKHESQSISTAKGSAGTPAWMAPELSFGEDGCTKASDIYSLGITFWELAARDRPFKKVANPVLIPVKANSGYRDTIPDDCPCKVATLIQACWDTDAQNRPTADTIVTYLKSDSTDFKSFLSGHNNQASSSSGYTNNLNSNINQNLNSAYQNNFNSIQPIPSDYQNNFNSAALSQLSLSSPIASSPAKPLIFSNTSNNSPSPSVHPITVIQKQLPQISSQTVNAFIKLIADGEQDQAEQMLKSNRDLSLVPGDVTDLAGRPFKNITGFQYAVWALDWHMWTMIRKYLPNEQASIQIQNMKTSSWIKQHGISASWQNLLDAQQKTIDLYEQSKWDEGDTQWHKGVGSAQCLLPAHVINEYCHPDRPFEPCPDFSSTAPFPRSRKTYDGEWLSATHNRGRLGESFAYLRYLGSTAHASPRPGVTSVGSRLASGGSATRSDARADHKACHTLLSTRVQQRDQLLVEFSIQPGLNHITTNSPKSLFFSNTSTNSSPSASVHPINVTQNQSPQISRQTVSTFLKLVADGEQDQAENMLKSNRDLVLYSSDVTDLADRSFKNITAFQYAVWALDWHMWTMIRKYLPNEQALAQIQNMKTGSWIKQHGISASWQNLIDALQNTIDLYNKSQFSEGETQWYKGVGGAQRLLPTHVVNEYCHPSRLFEPCPDFRSTIPFPRSRKIDKGEWYTATYNNGKLGETVAYLRHSYIVVSQLTPRGAWSPPDANASQVLTSGACDLKACHALLSTRVQQRDQLFAELLGNKPQTKIKA